jgi:hypothetical protein
MTEQTPLESFVLRYVEAVDGLWQPVEPQVYDVLLPPEVEQSLDLRSAGDAARLAFDPEALADYPQAHLMVFGNPTLDRIFQDAQALGQVGRVYVGRLNLAPHDLPGILRRNLALPEGVALQVLDVRARHYRAALFWFQATFVSDEKEQVTLAIGVDLHYGRPARHLLQLLQDAALSETSPLAYPDAAAISPAQGYALAREEAVRAITVAGHERLAELQRFLQRETDRINRYFADLREELDERRERAVARSAGAGPDAADAQTFDAQRAALDREEQAQLVELRRKMALSVQVKLLNMLTIVQPKLSVRVRLAPRKGTPGEADLVFEPVTQKPAPWPCPVCGRPTLALALNPAGQVVCADCAQAAAAPKGKR